MNRTNGYDSPFTYGDEGKRKKGLLTAVSDAGMSETDREYVAGLARNVGAANEQMELSRKRLDAWESADLDKYYKESQKNFLVPKDSEQRRRLQFVTTPHVVNEALDSYYNETFRPNLQIQRKEDSNRGMEEYKKYATVPGALPETALGSLYQKTDPIATLDKVMTKPDDGALDAIANRYAGYAGLDPVEYRRQVLEPAIRQRAINELVDEKTPKSSGEYIARGALRNSLLGSIGSLNTIGNKGVAGHRFIDDAAMENYNPTRTERFTAGVGGLLLDSGMFAGIGNAASSLTGKATNMVVNRAVSKMMANGATREIAEQTAKNAILGSLKTKIAQSATSQGLTLGTYDAAHSVVDDILHGEDVDFSSAASAFGKGAATGVALGAVGTPLRHASRGLTGGKRLAASAGILSAESAVFTASTEAAKMAAGIEIEPIDLVNDFGEGTATLLAMRMLHWKPSGASEKLNTVGRLKQHFRFSMPEEAEIKRAGVDPKEFIANVERGLNVYQKGSEKAIENIREDYLKLMSTSGLSAATRSKLLFLVENKLSSTPPDIVDYKVVEKPDGRFTFSTFDSEGKLISTKECNGREELKSAYLIEIPSLRRNRIAAHERELLQSYDSQNFFRQAGKYARETGTDVDVLSDIMYRKARKEEVTPQEQSMLDEILQRSNYNDSEVGQMLYSLRRNLEEQYGLHEGSLLGAIEKKSFYCSKAENEALNKYEQIMAEEVRKLHDGTSQQRARELSTQDNVYNGLGNSELKELEQNNFWTNAINTGKGLNEGSIPTLSEKYGIFADGLHKPADWDETYVWNTNRYRHTRQEVADMGAEAQLLAKRLGCEVELILDESELSVTDPEYPNKVRSCGWLDERNNKITINVPNNSNMNEVRKTVVHEVVGHKGLSELFGNYYYDFLEEVYQRGSQEVRDAIAKQAMRKNNSYHAATDEYLAILSERTVTTPEQRSILRRFYDFVREMLQRLNIYDSPITEQELVSLVQRHHSAILSRKSNNSYRSNAFRPFETAARRDGGYYNDRVARERYDDYMRRNPELDGIAEGFHDFKRNIYGEEPMHYRYRRLGEKGLENLNEIPYYGKRQLNKETKHYGARIGPSHTNFYLESYQAPNGSWYKYASDLPNRVKLYDYVFRTLRVHNPKRANRYIELIKKPKNERTNNENEELEYYRSIASQFDNTAKLKDILFDWELYTAYPDVAEMPVTFATLKGRNALYDVKNKRLIIDKRAFEDRDFKKELYYTTQHIIDDIEWFGVSPVERKSVTDRAANNYIEGRMNAFDVGVDFLERPHYFQPFEKELYKTRFGVNITDFRNKYKNQGDYLNKTVKFNWPDNQGTSLQNYALTPEELRAKLEGPLDIINKVINNSPRNMKDVTLREMENYKGIKYDFPEFRKKKMENFKEHIDGFKMFDDIPPVDIDFSNLHTAEEILDAYEKWYRQQKYK